MIHPQERALQRYNKELEIEDLNKMATLIDMGKHMIVGPAARGNGRFLSYIQYKNIPYKVLHQKQKGRARIITVYPFNPDEYNELLDKKEHGGMTDYLVDQFMKIFEVEDDKA